MQNIDCPCMLKSQDILIALKLSSLHLQVHRERQGHSPASSALMGAWIGWEADAVELATYEADQQSSHAEHGLEWTYASLSKRIGISASECNESVKRGLICRLLRKTRSSKRPVPDGKALAEFLVHGIKYVFPGQEGVLTRGVPTAFAAPVLAQALLSAGEHIYVWPDAKGNASGITLYPIHKSVPYAVKYDHVLYELLALVDAIRFGKLRESKMAVDQLQMALSTL